MKCNSGVTRTLVCGDAESSRYRPVRVALAPQPLLLAASAQPPAPRRRPRARQGSMALMGAAAAMALAGCTSLQPTTWQVQPNFRVEGSGMGTAQGHLALARKYEGEDRFAQALDAYQRAALAAPDDAEMQNTLGLALARQGQFGPAVTALRRAVALWPASAPLLNNLGYALLLDGRSEEAGAMFRLTLAVDPKHAVAARNLAHVDELLLAAAQPEGPERTLTAPGPVPAALAAVPELPAGMKVAQVDVELDLQPAAATELFITLAGVDGELPLEAAPAPAPVAAPAPGAAPNASATATATPAATAAVTANAAANDKPMSTPAATAAAPERTGLAGVRVEILNGNGVRGAAAQLRGWLGDHGVTAARLANLPPYTSATTEVLYRPGMAAAARELARHMPAGTRLVAAPEGGTRADVRVVIGHDMRQYAGCKTLSACAPTQTVAAAALGNAASAPPR